MAAELIDGAKVGARVREEVKQAVERMPVKPGLATILVGDDPASAIYVGSKRRACVELGIRDLHQHLSAEITQEALAELIVAAGQPIPRSPGSCCSCRCPRTSTRSR